MKKIVIGIGSFLLLSAIALFALLKSESKFATEIRCNIGSGTDCYEMLKEVDKDGKVSPQEHISNNLKYYEKACEKGFADACKELSYFYKKNKSFDKAKLYSDKSKVLYLSSCEKGNGRDCFDAADFSNSIFLDRPTTEIEKKEIAALLEQGCRFNHNYSCVSLAQMYLHENIFYGGIDIKDSIDKFEFALQKSCEIEPKKYCRILSEYYLQGDKFSPKSRFSFGKYYIALLDNYPLMPTLPKIVENTKYEKNIVYYLQKACLGDDEDACIGLWQLRFKTSLSLEERDKLLTKSCSLNNPEGCYIAAFEGGNAPELYKKACLGGLKLACDEIK